MLPWQPVHPHLQDPFLAPPFLVALLGRPGARGVNHPPVLGRPRATPLAWKDPNRVASRVFSPFLVGPPVVVGMRVVLIPSSPDVVRPVLPRFSVQQYSQRVMTLPWPRVARLPLFVPRLTRVGRVLFFTGGDTPPPREIR